MQINLQSQTVNQYWVVYINTITLYLWVDKPTALSCYSGQAPGHLTYVPEGQLMTSIDSHSTRPSGLVNL